MNRHEHRKGVLMMVGATLCWASAGPMVRNLSLTDGWEITFWRSLFMTLFVLGILFLQYRGEMFARIRAVGKLGFAVGSLWSLMYICFILALGHTKVANVLVLSSISPFVAAFMGAMFLHERVPPRIWFAMLIAVGGIALMFMDSIESGGLMGNLLALVIPIAFGFNIVLLRRAHATIDMMPTLVISGVVSMIVTLPLALPLEATASDTGLLAIMGIVQLAIGLLLLLAATPRLKAAELGLLAVLETPLGTLFTWLAVGERPGSLALVGGMIVIGALVVNEVVALRGRALLSRA